MRSMIRWSGRDVASSGDEQLILDDAMALGAPNDDVDRCAAAGVRDGRGASVWRVLASPRAECDESGHEVVTAVSEDVLVASALAFFATRPSLEEIRINEIAQA